MSLTDEQLTQMAATFMAYTSWRMELDPEADLLAWKSLYADTGAYVIRVLVVLEGTPPKAAAERISRLILSHDFGDRFGLEQAALAERQPAASVDPTLN